MDRLDNGFLLCQLAETLQEKFRQNNGELSPPGKVLFFFSIISPVYLTMAQQGHRIQSTIDTRLCFMFMLFSGSVKNKSIKNAHSKMENVSGS